MDGYTLMSSNKRFWVIDRFTHECSSNDVTEEGIQCMEDKDISTTQNLLSDCSKILNNKRQNLVTFYKNSSPQKFKGSKVDPDKLSEDSSLCWTCDLCAFQCSTYKSLLQHVSDFHAKDRKEDICEPTVSHLGEPFKSVTANEFQPDKSDSFVCPECGEIFSSVEKFSAHAEQKGHGSLHGSCWICGICEAAFFEENELNEHLVLHSAVVDDVPRSDNEERPVTILNQETTSDVNRCLVSVDEVSKNKYTSNDKIEPDSSVLDSDHLVQYEQFKNNLNSTYED
ncbi:zinc finger protein 516-like [Macrobrachium nipponense]|uniref:zinc finger protein 516-like n=1 Tax=Macrobrachium nipponense TaxID=159736 RepID=UPI0030C88A0C